MGHDAIHDLVQDIIRVARELGRVPKRDEYLQNGGRFSRRAIDIICGSYTIALHRSGVKYMYGAKKDKQEIRKEYFEKLQEEVVERKEVLFAKSPIVKNGLIISDRHAPFIHQDAIDFLIALNRKYKFDHIADVGDAEDYHALSFHDSDPDLPSAGHELAQAIEKHKPLYTEFPVMRIADSNHGSMVYRKGLHHGFPRHVLKSYREILEAPQGWTWENEIIWELPNNKKLLICHSYGGNVLAVSKKRGMSVVQGHHHNLYSIQFWSPCANELVFACQAGSLIDDVSLALAYNKTVVERPVLGCIRITDGLPYFLPMITDKNGRWTGFVP